MKIPFRFLLSVKLVVLGFLCLSGQDASTYITPPKVISDMLLAKPTPSVILDEHGGWMVLAERDGYPSVEELARPELRLAGLRINPENFSPSRQRYFNAITLQEIASGKQYQVDGLPSPLSASNISWSPDNHNIAFLNTTRTQADLYLIDVATHQATKVNSTPLNIVIDDYRWVDDNTLLYYGVVEPSMNAPKPPLAPTGPTVRENEGKAAPRPTYQDMIKSPFDEELFAFYSTTQLIKNVSGNETPIGSPEIYSGISVSPDGKYLLERVIQKPFSYLVPFRGFPTSLVITDLDGNLVHHVSELPCSETAPSGYDNVQNVPRAYGWRNDEPATLVWCEPLDSGLIKNAMEYHDAVYMLRAPFTSAPQELFKTKMRFGGTTWGNEHLALVTEGLRSTQITQTDRFNPSTGQMDVLFSRNTTDAYANPGNAVTKPNAYHRDVLLISDDGQRILFNNTSGSSPKGDLPFLMSYDLSTQMTDTLWRCADESYEYIVEVFDPKTLSIVTRKESKTEVPNYWLKNLSKFRLADQQLTWFTNPYPQLDGVTKEKITYTRKDGVTLTGELYLPAGYDATRDGPLPVLMWAYPREFQSADDAAQIRGSENRFTMLSWGSPVFYVTQGYAVLNNAEMPIVSTASDKKPNDDFVDQLTMNAEAAIDKLTEMGVGDPERVAVGGHSYGAFMTANLLAHTHLFKAGIARSGAYNRTLTPFGFQNEDRTYWQAPDVYNTMSPFMHADSIRTPLLLIHGELDNNTGTYPIQSERLFNAIKGFGGTVRYISLPYESHGYQGKENLLDMLAEQLRWLDKYVKGKGGGNG